MSWLPSGFVFVSDLYDLYGMVFGFGWCFDTSEPLSKCQNPPNPGCQNPLCHSLRCRSAGVMILWWQYGVGWVYHVGVLGGSMACSLYGMAEVRFSLPVEVRSC